MIFVFFCLSFVCVGKSTIIRALQKASVFYRTVSKLDRTPQVTFSHQTASDGIQWQYMDMPGQPEYFPTAAKFLQVPRAIIIVVIDVMNSIDANTCEVNMIVLEDECRLWLGMINQLAKQSAATIVKN